MYETHENSLPVLNLVRPNLDEPYLQPKSRWGYAPFLIALALIISLSLYLFLHASPLFDRIQAQFHEESGDSAKIKNYGNQLQSLQNKMTGFIAESLETRLAKLEKNVASGSVGTEEIRTFEELKEQLKLLENYSAGQDGNLIDPVKLEHQRFQAVNKLPAESDMFREMMRLKNLFYISLASSGFAAVMIGGYWWRSHQRDKQLALAMAQMALTLNKRELR